MLHPTDGNLHALAQYQAKVDADERYDAAIEQVMEDNPEMDWDEAADHLEALRLEAEESRAEAIADARAERAGLYSY